MVKCGVLFEVRTEFLNSIYTSFGFKRLTFFKNPYYSATFVYYTLELVSYTVVYVSLVSALLLTVVIVCIICFNTVVIIIINSDHFLKQQ
jgi:hypothetical protein